MIEPHAATTDSDARPDPTALDTDTAHRLARLVAAAARVPTDPCALTDHTSLVDDLDIDSILLVERIVNIETEFEIELTDEDVEIERMIRFGTLVATVQRRIGR
jgi:acyl carrier protein